MAALFVLVWIVGAAPAAVLNLVMRADNPRTVRLGRIGFALLLALDLFFAALVFLVDTANPASNLNMTRSLWWVTAVLGGVPIIVVSGIAVRRGYSRHRVVLGVAVLAAAALYLAFPLGFVPADQPLGGLGRFEHANHVLDVFVLLVPTLILLASELLLKQESNAGEPLEVGALVSGIRHLPRRATIAAVIVLVSLGWFVGAKGSGVWIGLAILVGGLCIFAWERQRSAVRRMRRDLGSSEKPAS